MKLAEPSFQLADLRVHIVTDGQSQDRLGASPLSGPPAEEGLTPKPGRGRPKGSSKKKILGVDAVAWTHTAVSALQVLCCSCHCPSSACCCLALLLLMLLQACFCSSNENAPWDAGQGMLSLLPCPADTCPLPCPAATSLLARVCLYWLQQTQPAVHTACPAAPHAHTC